MENFCLYNGKKIAKLETWNITSVELSSDYTSAIIQAESESNKSEYTLDITPLITNQYENGIDSYSSTIVNELTGVSDWVLDSDNSRIKYYKDDDPDLPFCAYVYISYSTKYCSFEQAIQRHYEGATSRLEETTISTEVKNNGDTTCATYTYYSYPKNSTSELQTATQCINRSLNPTYDPTAEREEKYLPLPAVAQQVISNAQSSDANAQQAIISAFNNITDGILNSDYSEFFEANKQPKQEGE